jgi:hypothetical protein
MTDAELMTFILFKFTEWWELLDRPRSTNGLSRLLSSRDKLVPRSWHWVPYCKYVFGTGFGRCPLIRAERYVCQVRRSIDIFSFWLSNFSSDTAEMTSKWYIKFVSSYIFLARRIFTMVLFECLELNWTGRNSCLHTKDIPSTSNTMRII